MRTQRRLFFFTAMFAAFATLFAGMIFSIDVLAEGDESPDTNNYIVAFTLTNGDTVEVDGYEYKSLFRISACADGAS